MFAQESYVCKVEWGKRGAREAAERGDITIVVDVLSFSSTVITALHHGAIIYPYPPPIGEKAKAYAKQFGAELLLGRVEAVRQGTPSLSPISYGPQDRGQSYVLCSLNGAHAAWLAADASFLLLGGLLNASAVAEHAHILHTMTGAGITVIPCGEHWQQGKPDENDLRPAIEDYLGAGAILCKLSGSKSPEAQVCEAAFLSSRPQLEAFIWDCGSGRELRELGFAEDVHHCSQLDAMQVVPWLNNDHFTPLLVSGGQQRAILY
ncbi:2-phosphosulfolactate phosphatase [Brevibacillus ruminantium]|uniref:Probable 2-phosphosulfolactate phosphatase n=1 Tax=Brevibacillus ruminantium TaxID=2950604 RepID=A0ABY4WM59_9BACL|nr:2-phosphosulfolactate phosphatase [Brevibacillus ruminantium]USG68133.1 2-phosphosulfolactate phosphatase [Brevibacillus ruminantium]